MGHADNSWFYTLRVGKDVQVSVATTSTKSTSTAEAGAKKDARAGKDGKHDGKDAKDGKGKGIGKSSDSYHANPQDPDAAADTTHRDFVCATHAPAAAGRGGLGCSWTGRVHGARVDMCDLQDVGEGLVVTGAQAMRLVGSIPSRKAAHISTSCSSASTRDDTSASSSSRSTSGDSHNKAGGGGGGSGAGGSAGDGAGAGSGPSSLQVVLSLSVWRDASAAASGQFEILPEYLLSLQRPLSSSGENSQTLTC